ncbi:hypothetical protein SRHO_G00295440 [Serrasalmus rhombeus]
MVKMAGAKPVFIPLRLKSDRKTDISSADWFLDQDELASKFNSKTKAIIINTPNNPIGKVFTRNELQAIADLCIKHDTLCLSDEVYEWLTYKGHEHVKIGGHCAGASAQLRADGAARLLLLFTSGGVTGQERPHCDHIEAGWNESSDP